ncbi:hypothetical protein P171DRAFT_289478 [Karstenula rhodostoma CBS 690.94]|uniref:Uncharacterized protein n=1 Tax=Karstenula rhodostoma CBS 690.94 TaxID=1392251 RepID=A0A9P4PLN7_9PLEO|nr:hypothetical protein P171DRAFT_289478 [Karstenula rhodostoma CBS 690.94]
MTPRPRDRSMLPSLHDWLTTSDSEPETFWSPFSGEEPIQEISTVSLSAPIRVAQEPGEAHRERSKASLKSSMKHVPNAEDTPDEPTINSSRSTEPHRTSLSLRRVKTVEFEGFDATRVRTVPSLKPYSSDIFLNTSERDESQGKLTTKRHQTVRGYPSCSRPGIKSVIAEPALTKTDVHVVTLAPTSEGKVPPRKPDLGTATPTMQTIKSAGSCHEVVWDDVPTEDNKTIHRKTSVANRALQTINSASQGGLEHVNSKLYEWNRGRGPGLESFAPQVIVFPDDEGHTRSVNSIADDDGNAAIRAPSNSQRTSGSPSCSTSTPGTAWPSRPLSQYVSEATDKLGVPKPNNGEESMLVVPDPETLPDQIRKPLADRRLSNIDDSEMKFRGHRDSVTVARSRLSHNGGVSPELFQVSELTAKRRMHARNRAKSEEAFALRRTPT